MEKGYVSKKTIYYKSYSIRNFELADINSKSKLYLLVLGSIIGFVNGFWGGGGGMLCVPTLTYLVGLDEKKSHATTILIMLPLSIASFVIYLLNGYFEWDLIYSTGIGFVIGGIVGAYLLKNITNVVLKLIFSIIIIVGGVWLIF